MSGKNPERPTPRPPEQERVSQRKDQIASRTYRVDSRAVAREMLFKIRMMALVRQDQAQRRSWSNPDGSRTEPST
jgi:hypothetical protein